MNYISFLIIHTSRSCYYTNRYVENSFSPESEFSYDFEIGGCNRLKLVSKLEVTNMENIVFSYLEDKNL